MKFKSYSLQVTIMYTLMLTMLTKFVLNVKKRINTTELSKRYMAENFSGCKAYKFRSRKTWICYRSPSYYFSSIVVIGLCAWHNWVKLYIFKNKFTWSSTIWCVEFKKYIDANYATTNYWVIRRMFTRCEHAETLPPECISSDSATTR